MTGIIGVEGKRSHQGRGIVVSHVSTGPTIRDSRASNSPLDGGVPPLARPLVRHEEMDTGLGSLFLDALTPRQRDVLALIARGRSDKEIARELRIGLNTVKTHCSRLYAHFDLGSHGNPRVRIALWYWGQIAGQGG